MLWLQYQLKKTISKRPAIDGSDLPPALNNSNILAELLHLTNKVYIFQYGLNADHTGFIGLNNFDDSGDMGHNCEKSWEKMQRKYMPPFTGRQMITTVFSSEVCSPEESKCR
jgi:hypothetical protein